MTDDEAMIHALRLGAGARVVAHPNPWVGCVVVARSGERFEGATRAPGDAHAEAVALAAAGDDARGATVFVTLEPCAHHGRTPPCADALIAAGVGRVVVGVTDPDPRVAGEGVRRLREAGIDVEIGVQAAQVTAQLAPYLHHRRTGRPYVVLKLAASLDGRTAAPDGSSRWITGPEARTDAHRLRAESDAVVVGAGTVRADDPALTVRHVEGPDPVRIVLGDVPDAAAVAPCRTHSGEIVPLLDALGDEGMVQVLVEGGADVAGRFHRAGLVDRYVVYLAPVLFGGDDGRALLAGPGAATMDEVWRGRIEATTPLGDDVRIDVVPPDVAETPDAAENRLAQN